MLSAGNAEISGLSALIVVHNADCDRSGLGTELRQLQSRAQVQCRHLQTQPSIRHATASWWGCSNHAYRPAVIFAGQIKQSLVRLALSYPL